MFSDSASGWQIVASIWGASSFCMMVWFLLYGLYIREKAVTVSDAVRAFFISLLPLAAPIGFIVYGIFYLEDHGDKVLFRSKKAAARAMAERMIQTKLEGILHERTVGH